MKHGCWLITAVIVFIATEIAANVTEVVIMEYTANASRDMRIIVIGATSIAAGFGNVLGGCIGTKVGKDTNGSTSLGYSKLQTA